MTSFPDKEVRAACWKNRDVYWDCLDTNAPSYNKNFPDQKEPSACAQLRKLYETSCPSQWVKHFDRKRTYEQFKKRMEKG